MLSPVSRPSLPRLGACAVSIDDKPYPVELALELVQPHTVAIVADAHDLDVWLRMFPGEDYRVSRRTAFVGASRVVGIPMRSAAEGLRGPNFDRVVVVGEPSPAVGRAVDLARMCARGTPGDVIHYNPRTRSACRWTVER